eukprot:scaffold107782_cov69-Attheya_sp.AAC.1
MGIGPLKRLHGLTDEACVVVTIATKHLSQDNFPSLKCNMSYIKLAKNGRELLKELNWDHNPHPECKNQAKIDRGSMENHVLQIKDVYYQNENQQSCQTPIDRCMAYDTLPVWPNHAVI